MPSTSTRFLLTVPTDPDPFITEDIAANWQALDGKAAGFLTGTVGTRPTAATANRGFFHYGTDTGVLTFSNGTVWVEVADTVEQFGYAVAVFDDATDRDTSLSGIVLEGMVCYQKDTDLLYRYDGASWIAVGNDASQLTTGTVPGARGVDAGSASDSVLRYNGTTAAAGRLYGGTSNPSNTTRLNYDGHLHATQFHGNGANLTALNGASISSGEVGLTRLPVLSRSSFSSLGSNSVAIDFSTGNQILTLNATGAVTVTGSNYTAGVSVSFRIVAGAASRNLTFPVNWKFVSFKPTTIDANKTGVLAVTSYGTTEANCVAAWAVEF